MIQLATALLLLVPQASRPKTTTVTFEIITPSGTGSRVAAQDWGKAFAKIGHIVTVRQQRASDGDGPEQAVTQSETRTSRRIKAIGLLDRKGRVHFGPAVFRVTEETKLRDWIDGLKKYGVQGDPKDQPLWGLSAKQFDKVFNAMAKPVRTEVKGKSIREAITTMEFPRELPIKWAPGTEAIVASAPKIEHQLNLYGLGTALGIILNDVGLGFLPQRQADSSLALLVTKRSKEALWPIGWQPKLSIAQTIPDFYKRVPVSLPNVSLTRVFKAIETRTKVPIHVDHYYIDAKGQEFDKMMVEVKPRQMSWNNVIRTVAVKNRLNYDVRVDELGKPFVWVSTTEVIQRRKDRFKK